MADDRLVTDKPARPAVNDGSGKLVQNPKGEKPSISARERKQFQAKGKEVRK